MSAQLPLALRWPAHQRFSHFVVGAQPLARDLAAAAASEADAPSVFLSGPSGSGKTHLLIATCVATTEAGRVAQYVPLRDTPDDTTRLLRALGGSDVLALDDVDTLVGDREREIALFDLFNRCRAEATTLVFAASNAPAALGFALPDLVSRLSSCAQASLRVLDEAGRRAVLRSYAAERGIALDDTVLDWLFTRQARDLSALVALLDRIDVATLAAQRRVTVPFLRDVFD